MNQNKDIKIGFWGGPELSIITLDRLHSAGFTISFIITSPDKPSGRKLAITAPPAKTWGIKNNIPVLQPEKLKDADFIETLKKYNCDVYVVMAYGKIIPSEILSIPKHKCLNIHPSLLPKFRGSCPIESAIIADEKKTGVTIIRMDNEMDHGPILAQETVEVEPWPPTTHILGEKLVTVGSDLLISILPDWLNGKISETEQNHDNATFTRKIEKGDGLIDLSGDPYTNYLKIQAYRDWPTSYFFKDEKRIKITQASFENGMLIIEKVIPEGKKEMSYSEFIR